MMPTWLYRQDFAKIPLNRHYNERNGVACEYCNVNIKNIQGDLFPDPQTVRFIDDSESHRNARSLSCDVGGKKQREQKHIDGIENILLKGCTFAQNYGQKLYCKPDSDTAWNSLCSGMSRILLAATDIREIPSTEGRGVSKAKLFM
ncbi:hypothetical protein TNCV_58071 [Trichonephila clavipes]|nr:hypothetical protein TNCV_58071 [Trichonephila clavipes]